MTLYDFMLANFLVLERLKRFNFYMLYDYNNKSVLGNMGRRDTGLEQDELGFGAEAEVTMWSEVWF